MDLVINRATCHWTSVSHIINIVMTLITVKENIIWAAVVELNGIELLIYSNLPLGTSVSKNELSFIILIWLHHQCFGNQLLLLYHKSTCMHVFNCVHKGAFGWIIFSIAKLFVYMITLFVTLDHKRRRYHVSLQKFYSCLTFYHQVTAKSWFNSAIPQASSISTFINEVSVLVK